MAHRATQAGLNHRYISRVKPDLNSKGWRWRRKKKCGLKRLLTLETLRTFLSVY